MSKLCAKTALYYDGELAKEEEAEVIEHLATCEACQRSLGDWMQLDAASGKTFAAAPEAPVVDRAPAPVVSLADARLKRRGGVYAVVGVVLAAAAAWLLLARTPGTSPDEPVLALAPTRSLEPRLSSEPFDVHRPYGVERGSAAPGEAVSLQAMAALERRGDRRGLADAHLLSGDHTRGRALLEGLPASADRDSDLAAAALLAGEPEAALKHANRALALDPKHPQAWWNRGLALRDLDLPLAAAASFERSATLGDPAWSVEAKARAAQLREPVLEQRRENDRMRGALEHHFLETDPVYPVEDVARHPGLARHYLHRASRAALSREDVLRLEPLARALDRVSGTKDATKLVAEIAAADFAQRRPLVEKFRALRRGELGPEEITALLALARRIAAWDILLPAAQIAGRWDPSNPEYEKAVADRGDLFLTLSATSWTVMAQSRASDLVGAEATALAELTACRDPWALECATLEDLLANVERMMHKTEEARLHGLAARRRAEALGDITLSGEILAGLSETAWLAGRDDLALAYAEETVERTRVCAILTRVDQVTADTHFHAGELAQMRAALRPRAECSNFLPPQAVNLRLFAARVTNDPGDIAAAVSAIEAYATHAVSPGERATADVYRGALLVVRDAPRGTELVEKGIAELRALPEGRRELRASINIAHELLLSEAAARGDFERAARRFEEEAEVKLPATCAVAASLDDDRAVAIVRGKDGSLRGRLERGRSLSALDAATVIPAEMLAALDGCDEVRVLARPPLHGRSDLLPPELAWSFLSPGGPVKAPAGHRGLLVTDVVPPPQLGLPRLLGRPIARSGDVVVAGRQATPERVLGEMSQADYVELHAHGLVNLALSDTSFLALSPEESGRYALTAGDLAKAKLTGAPTVVLAACRAAEVAPYLHERWSLPDAFLRAGARTVFAATRAIPDDGAVTFFGALRSRLERGEPPARALRDERQVWLARGQSWVASVILFERP